MSSLVIVESPAKAKTINKILGKDFIVKASVGHILDLPAKKIGVDVENGFEPELGPIPGKEKVIRELKKAAKTADKIYLAPDPDREGEAIAQHIASVVSTKANKDNIFRVTFNEITKRAVLEAMKSPGKIDMDRVEAQQARRVLDRLVGYNLSPLLWKKIRRGLSAGRVQSVAVRLVVEREREVDAFNQEEYWSLNMMIEGNTPPQFAAKLHKYNDQVVINRDAEEGKRFLITNEDNATSIADELKTASYVLAKIQRKSRKRKPAAPFITSTLQQEASRKLGYTAKKTMMLAQQLYEGIELGSEGSQGLITYMRTDSVRVAQDAQDWAKTYITTTFGADYAPKSAPQYKSKKSAQEAHEAVRPTLTGKTPDDLKTFLSRDQLRLFTLIWNRFVASQMKPADLEQTTLDIDATPKGADVPHLVRASGTVVKFPGFMALYTETQEDTEEEEKGLMPPLKEGEALSLKSLEPKQHFTQPPPRYTEASLVKMLEEKGIGRPSTYAAILSTIVDRKYVEKIEKRLSPSELGIIVNDYLVERFPELLDTGFTAKMEDNLDKIETGKHKWAKVLADFYKPFDKKLTEAKENKDSVKPEDIETDQKCDKCEKPMVIRWGRHGRFYACSGYPECKNTMPLEGEGPKEPEVKSDEKCPKCDSEMVVKSGRFGRFLACTKYPDCKGTKAISTGVKCPDDGGDIVEKRTKRGKQFWSCSNYPKCKFATWHRPLAEKCGNCKAELLVIKKEKSGDIVKACLDTECGFTSPYEQEAKEEKKD